MYIKMMNYREVNQGASMSKAIQHHVKSGLIRFAELEAASENNK